MKLARRVVVNVRDKANKLQQLQWLITGVSKLDNFCLSLASSSRKSLENLESHLSVQSKEVEAAIASHTTRLGQLEFEVSKAVSNERECQRKFEVAHHDLAQSTEETYDLKKSKEETEKYLEEYRAQKGDIEMVSGFVSILLRESIPCTVHDWKLADIRARLGIESEADLMKHDVNIMVKLIMALKNFDHGNNKELIAYYKANVGRTDWEFAEVPFLVSAKPRTDAAYEQRKVYQRVAAYLGMDPSMVPMDISVHVDGRSPLGDAPPGSVRSGRGGGFTPTLGSLSENFDSASEEQLEELQRRLDASLARKKRKHAGDDGADGAPQEQGPNRKRG
jgi:hypothetical protein